jgi:hypothetical protein
MKFMAIVVVLIMASCGWAAGDHDKDKKTSSSKVVDSGTFGIFINGKRIATEKFRIEQGGDFGTLNAEIKVDDGDNKAEQSAEMQVASNGELRFYKWRSTVPTHEETIVEPKEDFLIEHLTSSDQKKKDVPYILPTTTVILDDNFFSQRELLVWRYLQTGCTVEGGQRKCLPSHFGILVPHQHLAANTTVELLGWDKTTIKGVEKEFNKFKLDADGVTWVFWVDDTYKVIKIEIPSNKVEVIRD